MRLLVSMVTLTGALLFSSPVALAAAPTPILKGRLAALDIKQAVVDPGGKPIGEMTIAWHAVLSPRWLDPQTQSEGGGTRVAVEYFIHDALIKNMPQGKLTLSLAERAEMLADFTKAAFRLRPGLKFQDGTPITTEDVKWSYENYRGIRAAQFKEMTDRIELVDDRTIVFHFKQPFVDFMHWYSGGETGIGFVVPSKYYQQVGEAGFLAKPIGAGPYKVAAQPVANEMHFDAWEQYWRRVPGVAKIIVKSMPSLDARTAAIKTGAVDVAFSMIGTLNAIKADPNLRWVAKHTSPYWLTFPNWEDAKNPFNDKRVRQAVSLAINRGLLVQQGTENLGMAWGNWVGNYVDSAKLPLPEFNPDRARKLLAEAGHAQGLKIGGFLPFPPAFADGERVATHLQAVGIQGPLERTDLPKFLATRGKGKQSFTGKTQILLSVDLPVSLAAQMMEDYGTCQSVSSFVCDPKLDSLWKQYNASKDVKARHGYSQQMQRYVVGEYLAIPLFINALVFAVGPKVLPEGNAKPGEGFQKYWATQSNPFPIPWEDWQVKIQ